jgi:arginase
MRLSIITLPYNTAGRGTGGGAGPARLLADGLADDLRAAGHELAPVLEIAMSPEEEVAYGGWHRVGVANGHLARAVADAVAKDDFALGLLADCNGVLGMLGGLTAGTDRAWPRRVGLVWVDAHGDYNTPETSPSGMLGGMPVAVAAGKCLHELRRQSGLRVPLSSPDIIMAGLRDVDPAERLMIDNDGLVELSLEDMVEGTERLHWAMRHLSKREDLIYIHIDLDILNPDLAPAAGLPCAGGISGHQLGEALARMVAYPKVGALAFVSYNAERDQDGHTGREVAAAILGAAAGLRTRAELGEGGMSR